MVLNRVDRALLYFREKQHVVIFVSKVISWTSLIVVA